MCYDVILFSPYVVIELVIAAGIFPEGKQGLAMAVVCRTLLSQEKGAVPKLVCDFEFGVKTLISFNYQVCA